MVHDGGVCWCIVMVLVLMYVIMIVIVNYIWMMRNL